MTADQLRAGAGADKPVRPRPVVSDLTRPYWEGLLTQQLLVQRCRDCGSYQHPPAPLCTGCGGFRLHFCPLSGEGRLWSWTVTHVPFVDGFAGSLPYVTLCVQSVEQSDLFFLSDHPAATAFDDRLRIGARMAAQFPCPHAPLGEPLQFRFADGSVSSLDRT